MQKRAILIAFLIFLTGCGKMKPNLALDAVYIKPGTKKERVIELIGKPQKIIPIGAKREIWIYQQGDKFLKITFNSSVVEEREYDEAE